MTQREKHRYFELIELRGECPDGALVKYQAQVLASHCDLLRSIIQAPWEEMRMAYRQPQNHGGTTAPVLKWDVDPRLHNDDDDVPVNGFPCDFGFDSKDYISELGQGQVHQNGVSKPAAKFAVAIAGFVLVLSYIVSCLTSNRLQASPCVRHKTCV